jgi:DMSO/TMAO reductase YedYZ molybdopterin-dependent catalytic subunit
MAGRHITAAATAIIAVMAAAPGRSAEPVSPPAVTVAGPAHGPVGVGVDTLARLPARHLSISFLTEHGVRHASFDGPLLWAVLTKTGVIDPAKRRNQVTQFLVIAGRDGYHAVLALAEIAPDFENKSVVLADRMDGKPLGSEHLRVVVPLDEHGGRSVRDVVRIQVLAAPP